MRKLFRRTWLILTAPFRFIVRIFQNIFHWFQIRYQRIKEFFAFEEEDTPLPDAFAKTVQNPQGLLEHLNALRKHLVRATLAMVITTAFSFALVRDIMEFLARPLEGGLDALKAIEVTENVGTVMRVALLAGFALAFPYIILEIWLFVAPGLSRRSRWMGLLAIPIAALLFISGMAFAYYIMLPVALPFLFNFMGLTTEARPASYFNFITSVLFWIGLSFQFPLASYVLADFGVIKYQTLIQQWRVSLVIIAIIAAAVTPTVDPVNMSVVMLPMVVLYFFSIAMAFVAQRTRMTRLNNVNAGL
jgi:sec-independent protein translocase protein TatC